MSAAISVKSVQQRFNFAIDQILQIQYQENTYAFNGTGIKQYSNKSRIHERDSGGNVSGRH